MSHPDKCTARATKVTACFLSGTFLICMYMQAHLYPRCCFPSLNAVHVWKLKCTKANEVCGSLIPVQIIQNNSLPGIMRKHLCSIAYYAAICHVLCPWCASAVLVWALQMYLFQHVAPTTSCNVLQKDEVINSKQWIRKTLHWENLFLQVIPKPCPWLFLTPYWGQATSPTRNCSFLHSLLLNIHKGRIILELPVSIWLIPIMQRAQFHHKECSNWNA